MRTTKELFTRRSFCHLHARICNSATPIFCVVVAWIGTQPHTHTHTYTCAHIRYAGMAMTLAEKERKDLRQACCQGSLSSELQGFWMGIVWLVYGLVLTNRPALLTDHVVKLSLPLKLVGLIVFDIECFKIFESHRWDKTNDCGYFKVIGDGLARTIRKETLSRIATGVT